MGTPEIKAEELTAIIHEIQARVRARYPEGEARGLGVPLPNLMPLLHARDAAEAKVAAIGSVNPRAGGPVNAVIQWAKNTIARGLGWFVRDQIDYNRAVVQAIEANLEALNEVNRTLVAVGARLSEADTVLTELKDMRSHWLHWREEWERKYCRTRSTIFAVSRIWRLRMSSGRCSWTEATGMRSRCSTPRSPGRTAKL
ncbi:MAG: hypothetical protein WKF37_00745 [Bryobacteraceae bacterium]